MKLKRYWKSILLSTVIVFVIGVLYVQSSFSQVEFRFENISGDEKELDNLSIQIEYQTPQSYQMFDVTTAGTKEKNLMQDLQYTANVDIVRLVEQYRNFMRGKMLDTWNFYEDENQVVYAYENSEYGNSSELVMDIDVLDKNTEESTPFQVSIPNTENYSWVVINSTQVVDGMLKVVAICSRQDTGDDLCVYTIDLEQQKLVAEQVIYSSSAIENGDSYITIINNNTIKPQKYLLVEVYEYLENDYNVDNTEYMIYNVENNELQQIDTPDEIVNSMYYSSNIFDSILYVSNGSKVYQYDIESGVWGEEIEFFEMPTTVLLQEPYVKLMNNKLYTIYFINNEYHIFIGNLNTGESLYEGMLTIESEQEEIEGNQLYISNLEEIE